jgi:hypothetical protein
MQTIELAPRALPAGEHAHTLCQGCMRDIVWAMTVSGPNGPGGKLIPLDPIEDLEGNVVVTQPRARGRLLARVMCRGELADRPMEYLAMTHFASCPTGSRPLPPENGLEPPPRPPARKRRVSRSW